MPTIALTGNFGMGKSTVLRLFGKLGAYTFDVDDFVHEILKKPDIIKKTAQILGKEVVTRKGSNISINKKRTADIIFHDHLKRKAFEKVIHEEVLKKIKDIKAKILRKKPSAVIIFEIPLLFEAGYRRYFDKVIVVHSTRDIAIRRLMKKNISRDEALRRMRVQMPISRKKKLADFLIDNNNDIQTTKKRVEKLMKKIV
jgi:dephospho-CoA kinase